MARYLGPKCKQCRREKMKLFLKGEHCVTKCPIDKKGAVPPGQKGARSSFKRSSDYGRQLREKQKVKKIYGISEKQLKNYFQKAFKSKHSTSELLLQMLESRLDNIIYRLGFAPSRSLARQIVSHKHVLVDGKKVNLPAYQLKADQVVTLGTGILEVAGIKKSLAEKAKMPAWLKRKAAVGQIVRMPNRDEIEADIDDQLIVEYYSR
jgi:small subunit ribosomal protein S4